MPWKRLITLSALCLGMKAWGKPSIELESPKGGWTVSRMFEVKGRCSEASESLVWVNVNGARYFIQTDGQGAFQKRIPTAQGLNRVVVECRGKGGVAQAERVFTGNVPATRFKVILTSDSPGMYADLHVLEPDGTHVYWAETTSSSGGLFFLNESSVGMDSVGYGPYLYVHPNPQYGVYVIATQYYPSENRKPVILNLDIILDEGTPLEQRKRFQIPLMHPWENKTLAYVQFLKNGQVKIFIPGKDPLRLLTPEMKEIHEKKSKDHTFLNIKIPKDLEEKIRYNVSMLAYAQLERLSPVWDENQRDCAGFVRFLYRESLRITPLRKKELRLPDFYAKKLVNIPQFLEKKLPGYPYLWKVQSLPVPLFKSFADAETLVSQNFFYVSKDVRAGKTGDILVFARSYLLEEPWHVMVLGASNDVVYHTGDADVGLRKVPLELLVHKADAEWRPVAQNPSFLGVFRWNYFAREDMI